MSQYEMFECDVCHETYKIADRERDGSFHGHFSIFSYGERKGYANNNREAAGDICDTCCCKVLDALGIELNG